MGKEKQLELDTKTKSDFEKGDQLTIKNCIDKYSIPVESINISFMNVDEDFIGIFFAYFLELLTKESVNIVYEYSKKQKTKDLILEKCPEKLYDENKPQDSDNNEAS